MISIVIPVKDGGADLVRCLDAISRQRIDEDVEVVVVDSGSRDGSAQRAAGLGARVHSIPASEFHHGRTRNLGASLARGETLVFTSQDAYAADDSWLATLTAPLRDDTVAGVYGRQLPHEDATPPERYFLDFLYGPDLRVQQRSMPAAGSPSSQRCSRTSTLRFHVWCGSAYPFDEDIVMSEDQEWSRRVLLAGLEIVYQPEAAVYHSHTYSMVSAMRRFFDSGARRSARTSMAADSKAALGKRAPATRKARSRGCGRQGNGAGSRIRRCTSSRSSRACSSGDAIASSRPRSSHG